MNLALPGAGPVATTALVLVQQPGNGDNGGQGEDFGKSSPVGFLLLLVFLVAVALLVRSMTKHLKRVPKTFDKEEAAAGEQEKQQEKSEKSS
ncbi:hypothetical protein [Amycolatopsis pithecellobii]|uniref:Preprotein translocase subunit SecG n=1 Tax=Amycolatopsis pithecellobii TaxID=664692 RepID=A0A6N7YQQ3_9PSEU|nr:hypothetical protein [Amycolatopsis pithecellobii]MTD54228.1 hypothetical protein [Amycolatopsis pithecellobii]